MTTVDGAPTYYLVLGCTITSHQSSGRYAHPLLLDLDQPMENNNDGLGRENREVD